MNKFDELKEMLLARAIRMSTEKGHQYMKAVGTKEISRVIDDFKERGNRTHFDSLMSMTTVESFAKSRISFVDKKYYSYDLNESFSLFEDAFNAEIKWLNTPINSEPLLNLEEEELEK